MANTNLPPLKRDNSSDIKEANIIQSTAVDIIKESTRLNNLKKSSSNNKYNKINSNKNRNNVSNSTNTLDVNSGNNQMLKIKADKISQDISYQESEDSELVPFGYFNKNQDSFGSPVHAYSTSRHDDNRITSSIEFPQLNKTIRSETLYSLKSQTNASPHDRIMKSLQRRNGK